MHPSDLSALAELTPSAKHVLFAKDQPEYLPLSALVFEDGKIMTEWTLSEAERLRLIAGERIRLWVWTYGRALQPVSLEVTSEKSP